MRHVRTDYVRVINGLRKVLDKIIINNEPALRDRAIKAQYHISELSKLFYETYSTTSVNQTSNAAGASIQNDVNNVTSSSSSGDFSTSSNGSTTSQVDDFSKSDLAMKIEVVSDDTISSSKLSNDTTIQAVSESQVLVDKAPVENQKVLSGKDAVTDLLGFNSINSSNIPLEAQQGERRSTSVHKATTISSTEDKVGSLPSSKAMRERAVPATQMGRLFGFGSLAVRMAMGVAVERATNSISGSQQQQSYISDDNAERLAEALCRMRGAALKLGQMLSLQDEASLPSSLSKALERVKQAADYMPKRQLETQLVKELGHDWRSKFLDFDALPIAAASIGQ
eukprot:gene31983-41482_t